jgi:DNA repair exonuclease SbcCD ATPase subunit
MTRITTTSTPPVVYQFTTDELRQKLSEVPEGFEETVTAISSGDIDEDQLRERACELLGPAKSRQAIRAALAVRRTLRGDIEAKRKELKAGALEYGRKVDAVAKELIGIVLETETPLKAMKQAHDDEQERIKREREEAERQVRESELRRQREEEEARLRAEREAEEKRIAEERAKLEAERKAAEESARAEREKLEVERAKLKAEREAQEAAQRAEQARRDAEARAERERIDAERRAIEEQRRQVEREEAERQAKIRAEQEAKERAERDRREAEEAAVRERERQAALASRLEALKPDKERAVDYMDRLLAVEKPHVDDPDMDRLLDQLRIELGDWKDDFSRFGDADDFEEVSQLQETQAHGGGLGGGD